MRPWLIVFIGLREVFSDFCLFVAAGRGFVCYPEVPDGAPEVGGAVEVFFLDAGAALTGGFGVLFAVHCCVSSVSNIVSWLGSTKSGGASSGLMRL